MDNPNHKGNVAELEIATAAAKLGLAVYGPMTEHSRCDLVIEIGDKPQRVQCKWGRLSADSSVIVVQISGSRLTPNGYVRTPYQANEIDLVGVYCGGLDRCYLLPEPLFVGRNLVQLRVTPQERSKILH